jgi:hypothetical protein
MSATHPVWQAVLARVQEAAGGQRVRKTGVARLALLVTGLVLAKSAVVSRVAAELAESGITAAQEESIARRLRRTLAAPLPRTDLYERAAVAALGWEAPERPPTGPLYLVLDESSQDARVHLLRLSAAYRGGAVALAWRLWEQNVAQPPGAYWQALDAALADARALLPPGAAVTLLADRAYGVPPLVDRLAAHGWSFVLRLAVGSVVWRDRRGREQPLRALLARHVQRPGQRWKGRGQLFKGAGWRTLSVVAYWQPGEDARLVVITDGPPAWAALAAYGRRFWCEAAFRADKTAGWDWEANRVPGVARQAQLLLALAWASLIAICLGVQAADDALARLATQHPPPGRRRGRPRAARASLFTLGLRRLQGWVHRTRAGPLPWSLPRLAAPSWSREWHAAQSQQLIWQTVRL